MTCKIYFKDSTEQEFEKGDFQESEHEDPFFTLCDGDGEILATISLDCIKYIKWN